MAQLPVVFNVPELIDAGIKSGNLSIFGGVVRDNAGRIVHMLKEGTRISRSARGPWALGILGVAAAAGVGYGIYKFLNRKRKRLELDAVDRAIFTYILEARSQRLTVTHIRKLAFELRKLIDTMESPGFEDARFEVDAEAASKLHYFYLSLRDFNLQLQAQTGSRRMPPRLVQSEKTLTIARAIKDQLLFQKKLWPAYARMPNVEAETKTACPKCGFQYGWDGRSCKHCRYRVKRTRE